MKDARISQKRIAEEAGVSIMTVSRVLRGKEDVAQGTRERVQEVAGKYGYRPNLLVRGIQTGKTGTIGVLLPPFPFYDQLLSGIHDELVQADHVPINIWSASDAVDKSIDAHELTQIHRLLDRRVDGVILKPVDEAVSDDYLREVWERGIPLVVVDRALPRTHADFVGTDDLEGGRLVAQHLLDLGHRQLAQFLPGDTVSTYALRCRGFEEAVSRVDEGAPLTTMTCVQREEDVRSCAEELLSMTPRPTAIFAAVDSIVPVIYDVAEKRGLRIPEELSVIGFGDLRFGPYLKPPLTTVDQSPYTIGRRAARLLLDRSEGTVPPGDPVRIRLAPKLIVRGSTARAPGAGERFDDRETECVSN